MKVSVVICTLNRSAMLKEAIESVLAQTLPAEQRELIIVDNGSTDDTAKMVNETYGHRGDIRYLVETTPGISPARNAGGRAACGDIIVYLDDDEVAKPDWLEQIVATYREHPDAQVVGGKIDLCWEGQTPDWYHPSLSNFLGEVNYGEPARPVKLPQHLGAGNISIPGEVLRTLGYFSTIASRSSQNWLSGEDLDLLQTIQGRGGLCYYAPQAIIWHRIPASRLTKDYFRMRAFWGSRGEARVDRVHHRTSTIIRKSIIGLVRMPYQLVRLGLYRLFNQEREALLWSTFIYSTAGYLTGWLRDRQVEGGGK